MLKQIKGLHHVTSLASGAAINNAFFTKTLGLRRVKKTVNFDVPDVYHLYYGDAVGTPGSVMTYFPFPDMSIGVRGAGEVGITNFSVPEGSLDFWQEHLSAANAGPIERGSAFGEARLSFKGPDCDDFSLIEVADDDRTPWTSGGVRVSQAIRGFHSATVRVVEKDALKELLGFMNYDEIETRGSVTRMAVANGNGAHILDIEEVAGTETANQGAGSVHHIAFSVEDRTAQLEVRKALIDTGYAVTSVIDRDYFWAIYFRSPGGVLFEIATSEPGFDCDEDIANLGKNLKLPARHEHLRSGLELALEPIDE